ncbi:MAG: hypothetical protein V3S41_00470 [Spirochaetia bacterium]
MNRGWILPFLVIVVVAGCRSSPESLTVTLSASSTALATAVALAEEVPDPARRAEVLAIITEGFLQTQNRADALQVVAEAARLVNDIPISTDVVRLQLWIAELLLAADEADVARRLIVEATTFTQTLRDEAVRADLLPVIVQAAIVGEDDTRDLLPAAVDPVYIIEDTSLRAQTFIAIAEAYQLVGVGQSVVGLIQQAIPAIRSVADPFRRAFLFAGLSSRAVAAGEHDLARALVEDAEEQLIDGMVNADPDPDTVAAVLQAVTRERGGSEAMLSISAFRDRHARAVGYLAVAVAEGAGSSAELALGLAVESAYYIADPDSYGTLMTSISHAYLSMGLRAESLETAEYAAARLSENQTAMSNAETLGRLAGVYALLDRTDLLRRYLRQIEAPYLHGLILVAVAELLIDEGQQGVADDFLVDALLEADNSDFLSDSLREKIVREFARSGNYSLAIRTVERMSDPSLRAKAVAFLGFHADPNGGLSDSQLRDLQEVLES